MFTKIISAIKNGVNYSGSTVQKHAGITWGEGVETIDGKNGTGEESYSTYFSSRKTTGKVVKF